MRTYRLKHFPPFFGCPMPISIRLEWISSIQLMELLPEKRERERAFRGYGYVSVPLILQSPLFGTLWNTGLTAYVIGQPYKANQG